MLFNLLGLNKQWRGPLGLLRCCHRHRRHHYSCHLFWKRKGESEGMSALPHAVFCSVLLFFTVGNQSLSTGAGAAKPKFTFWFGLGLGLGSGSGWVWATKQP